MVVAGLVDDAPDDKLAAGDADVKPSMDVGPEFFAEERSVGVRVAVYNEPNAGSTQITVESTDRPGLLLAIMQVISRLEELDLERAFVESRSLIGRGVDRFFVRERLAPRTWGQLRRERFEEVIEAVIAVARSDQDIPGLAIGDALQALWSTRQEGVGPSKWPVRGVVRASTLLAPTLRPMDRELTVQVLPRGAAADPDGAIIAVTSPNGRGLFLRAVRTLSTELNVNIRSATCITDADRTMLHFHVSNLSVESFALARKAILESVADWRPPRIVDAEAAERAESEGWGEGTITVTRGKDGSVKVSREQAKIVPVEVKPIPVPTSPVGRLFAPLLIGLRQREQADPNFRFKIAAELMLDETMTLLTHFVVRGNPMEWSAVAYTQVFAHMLQAALNDFTLVYCLAPTGAQRDENEKTGPAHVFQPGSFTVGERIMCFLKCARLYGTIGLCNTIISRTIALACAGAVSTLTPEYFARAALAGAIHMGLSSNTRYQVVNGFEVLLYRNLSRNLAQLSSVVLRWCNMLLGSRLWMFLAGLVGL